MLYYIIQYYTIYNTILYSIQYDILYSTICYTLLYYMPYYTIYFIVLYYTILCCTIYYTILYTITPHACGSHGSGGPVASVSGGLPAPLPRRTSLDERGAGRAVQGRLARRGLDILGGGALLFTWGF